MQYIFARQLLSRDYLRAELNKFVEFFGAKPLPICLAIEH